MAKADLLEELRPEAFRVAYVDIDELYRDQIINATGAVIAEAMTTALTDEVLREQAVSNSANWRHTVRTEAERLGII
ncbi:hypothetical protein [Gordonia sp. CPCC 205333]|uniref:hypothetical protein n=1 Tax=Gordonia sp. CPCC 205333 TaxID=3140790 RepID=UPI003AF3F5CB